MDPRSKALLALGLVLLSVPIWAPFLDITGTDYVYERSNVTIEGDRIVLGDRAAGPTDQIACFHHPVGVPERHCQLERALVAENLTVSSDLTSMSGDVRVRPPRYVVFGGSGRPYERTTRYDDAENTYKLGLEPVSPQHVLQNASDGTVHRPAVQRALETGSARSDERLFEGASRLYEIDDGYAVVHLTHGDTFLSAKPMVERGFEGIFVGIGALLVFWAGRSVEQNDGRP